MRLRMSAKARPARRPSRFAVVSGSLHLPALESRNQAAKFGRSGGGERKVGFSTFSAVMDQRNQRGLGWQKTGGTRREARQEGRAHQNQSFVPRARRCVSQRLSSS